MARFVHRAPRVLLATAVVGAMGLLAAVPANAAGAEQVSVTSGSASQALAITSVVELAATTGRANARIAAVLPNRLRDSVLGRAVSVRVYDTATATTVFSRSSAKSFRVASNTKLVTAATALQALGPNRKFPTTVVLGQHGHIYLVGGGDPLLSSRTLSSLAATAAKALKERGFTHTTVHLDDTLFAPWKFPAGFSSACSESHQTRGFCITPVRALTMDRHSHADNALDAVRYFTSRVGAAAGITASYGGRDPAPVTTPEPEVLARYAGHRLDDAITAMLFHSDDEIAETLFRHVAVATGHRATMAGGRNAQREVLADLGVPLDGVVTSSGSGRSINDRFTAMALVRLLRTAIDGDHPRMAALRDGTSATDGHPLLMRAGIDGTLATSYGRYSSAPSSCARGKVLAKTGTLADAIALSGFARGSDGKWKVFSIFVNNRPTAYSSLTTRQHVDRIAASVTGCY